MSEIGGADVAVATPLSTGSMLSDHGHWRPEWDASRPCLYWYALFDTTRVARTFPRDLVAALDRTPWADPVPVHWLHLTLCDVGFCDELDNDEVDRVTADVTSALAGSGALHVELGPVVAFPSAIALTAGPLDRLRTLQGAVRHSTERALGPQRQLVHRHEFWPHVSLAYVNREVCWADVHPLLDQVGSAATTLHIDRVILASVVRRQRHYEWKVAAEIDLHADTARRWGD